MVQAVLDGSTLVVTVSGSIEEFAEDLAKIKRDFAAADREFDSSRRVWLIRNLDNYASVDLVQNARRSAELQLTLF